MILFTNGCSWTYGGGLDLDRPDQNDIRLSSVWPHFLGQLMSADNVVNLSDGCGSNARVVRTTYDWILNQNTETLKNTVAVIQWTELSRYELYLPRFENDHDGWIKCKADIVGSHIQRPLGGFLTNYNDTRLSLYTDQEGMYNWLSCCESLHSLFNRFGIRYYFWANGPDYKNDPYIPNIYKEYFKKFNWLENYNRWEYSRINPDPHPSVQGHKEIAQIIFDLINS
jgi:hypothetical protein